MATTRKPEGSEDIPPEQRASFDAYVNELAQLGSPPPHPGEGTGGPKKVTDAEWDSMTDRQRESWVRQLVDFRLDELSRDDEIARQRRELDELKNAKTPEVEGTPKGQMPTMLQRLSRFLWGSEPDKP